MENVAKLADKTLTSTRVALTSSIAAFIPDTAGKKKLLQHDLVASRTLRRCRELRKMKQKVSRPLITCTSKCTFPWILVQWDKKQLTGERQVDKWKNYIALCIRTINGNIPGRDPKGKIF